MAKNRFEMGFDMVYVMSDIHGNSDNFKDVLSQLNLRRQDTLYILGDMIDRDDNGTELLRQIMQMDNVHCIIGNHELMALNVIVPEDEDLRWARGNPIDNQRNWIANGGISTYNSLYEIKRNEPAEYTRLLNYLMALPTEIEIELGNGNRFLLVHSCPTESFTDEFKPMYMDSVNFSVWHRTRDFSGYPTDKTVVFGHTPTCFFEPGNQLLSIWHGPNVIGIDCGSGLREAGDGAPYQGRLAALRLDDMTEFYSK